MEIRRWKFFCGFIRQMCVLRRFFPFGVLGVSIWYNNTHMQRLVASKEEGKKTQRFETFGRTKTLTRRGEVGVGWTYFTYEEMRMRKLSEKSKQKEYKRIFEHGGMGTVRGSGLVKRGSWSGVGWGGGRASCQPPGRSSLQPLKTMRPGKGLLADSLRKDLVQSPLFIRRSVGWGGGRGSWLPACRWIGNFPARGEGCASPSSHWGA